MATPNPNEISDLSNSKKNIGSKQKLWLFVFSLIILVLFTASLLWGFSERKRADELENALSEISLSPPIVAETQSCEEVIESTEDSSNYASGSEATIENFKAAFESGDYEQVRDLFTTDGVLTTAANVHEAIMKGDTSNLADRVGESEFTRLATVHRGQELTILGDPLMIGDNTLAFAWQWSDGVDGTAILHLRNGKIVICILNPSQYRIPSQ